MYTDNCNAGPFELREHPPQELSRGDVESTLDFDDVYENPFTLIWRFENGLDEGQIITIIYTIDAVEEGIDENDFYARAYSLVSETTEVIKKGVLVVTDKAFVGDEITISLENADGDPIPNVEITIITPYGYEMTVTTDESGEATFQPGAAGVYSYRVDGYILRKYVETHVTEKPTVQISSREPTDTGAIVATVEGEENATGDLLTNLLAGASTNIGIFGVVVVLVIAVAAIVLYVFGINPPEAGGKDELEGKHELEGEMKERKHRPTSTEKTIVLESGHVSPKRPKPRSKHSISRKPKHTKLKKAGGTRKRKQR